MLNELSHNSKFKCRIKSNLKNKKKIKKFKKKCSVSLFFYNIFITFNKYIVDRDSGMDLYKMDFFNSR